MKRTKYLILVMIVGSLLGCNILEYSKNMNSSIFLRQAANSTIFEISLSNLAIQKATNSEVKAFAEIMVADHTNIRKELSILASQKEIPLPDTMDVEKQSVHLSLSQEPGIIFDKKYIDQMLIIHEMDIAKFDSATRYADDKEVREWAAKQLPILRTHKEHTKEMNTITDSL